MPAYFVIELLWLSSFPVHLLWRKKKNVQCKVSGYIHLLHQYPVGISLNNFSRTPEQLIFTARKNYLTEILYKKIFPLDGQTNVPLVPSFKWYPSLVIIHLGVERHHGRKEPGNSFSSLLQNMFFCIWNEVWNNTNQHLKIRGENISEVVHVQANRAESINSLVSYSQNN